MESSKPLSLRLHSPLVVLVGVWVDDVPDEAVVMAAVCRARVHRDADEVVLVALCDLGLTFFPKTYSTGFRIMSTDVTACSVSYPWHAGTNPLCALLCP